jgi:hypothetical protein
MSAAAFTPEPKAAETTVSARVQNNDDLLDNMAWLPCRVTVELPVVRFTIGDLLALTQGSIVETACNQTSDVPLRVNRLLIGWTEFEVIGDRLACASRIRHDHSSSSRSPYSLEGRARAGAHPVSLCPQRGAGPVSDRAPPAP